LTNPVVSVDVVDQVGETDVWSWRFLPTAGRFNVELMPRAFSATLSPIPEWRRMCGVPIGPADKTTSFPAVNTSLGPEWVSESEKQQSIRMLTGWSSSEFHCSEYGNPR